MGPSKQGISASTRALVLKRDGSTCQMCGAVSGEPHHEFPRQKTRITVGRFVAKPIGGSDDASNLRAICSVCAQGIRNLTLVRPSLLALLVKIRRATRSDQMEVLRWLMAKYPLQAASHGERQRSDMASARRRAKRNPRRTGSEER